MSGSGACLAAGKTRDAIALCKRILAGREQALGAGRPDTLPARALLASAYDAAGQMGAALQLRQEACRLVFLSLSAGYLTTFADPDLPDFVPAVNTIHNASSANPDFVYYQATIDGTGAYRLTGRRGDALFVLLDIAAGGLGVMDELGPSLGTLDFDELTLGPDGDFDLLLSPVRPSDWPGDWRALDPRARTQ